MEQVIDQFKGKYHFLSNYFMKDLIYKGVLYSSAEVAFQAQKCPAKIPQFLSLTSAEAKRLGRKVKLRPDWEEVKDEIMYEIIQAKFRDTRLKNRLLGTGDAILVEGNDWGDRYWGMVDGVGENKLGKILMRVREELRNEHN